MGKPALVVVAVFLNAEGGSDGKERGASPEESEPFAALHGLGNVVCLMKFFRLSTNPNNRNRRFAVEAWVASGNVRSYPTRPDGLIRYLRILARIRLSPQLRRVLDSSDLVEETMLKAWANRERFLGQTSEQRRLDADKSIQFTGRLRIKLA